MGKLAGKRPMVLAAASQKGLTQGSSPKKKKTNSKPKYVNEQEIPYRLREIMKSCDELKNPKSRKKKKGSEWKPRLMTDIPVPKFRRRKGELESSYIRRMEIETQHVMFLSQNQQQREPEKEEPSQKKSQKRKKTCSRFQQKKLDKIRKQKEEKKVAMLEKDLLKDSVVFGEVVLQPPTLTTKPRKSVTKSTAGQRQLLLTSLLGSDRTPSTHLAVHASLARQRIVQEERERVVQAYRDIRKRKGRASSLWTN